jgi:hypothetical protein
MNCLTFVSGPFLFHSDSRYNAIILLLSRSELHQWFEVFVCEGWLRGNISKLKVIHVSGVTILIIFESLLVPLVGVLILAFLLLGSLIGHISYKLDLFIELFLSECSLTHNGALWFLSFLALFAVILGCLNLVYGTIVYITGGILKLFV